MEHHRSPRSEGLPPNGGWFKSSYSGAMNTCVEVRQVDGLVQVRDSKYRRRNGKDPTGGPIITLTLSEWRLFLAQLAGATDAACPAVTATSDHNGAATLHCASSKLTLSFTAEEWNAFLAGVRASEFALPPTG
jgi:Domain of unknown function (DUF397)